MIPSEPLLFQQLLEAYVIDKAFYELVYELNNRPKLGDDSVDGDSGFAAVGKLWRRERLSPQRLKPSFFHSAIRTGESPYVSITRGLAAGPFESRADRLQLRSV